MKIVIIEDEKNTAADLAATITAVNPQSEIVRILSSVADSLKYFETNDSNIDLIFSDIQLSDGLSFEIFRKIETSAPIIFCTAYDEYALNAFRVNGIHYMLKPFSTKTVNEAFQKYKTLFKSNSYPTVDYSKLVRLLEDRVPEVSSLLVFQKDKITPVQINQIALFYIDDEITYICTFDNKTFHVNKTMNEAEAIAGDNFFRANRQFLVNRDAINDASVYFARKLILHLKIKGDFQVVISKEKATLFLNWLTGKK